MAAVQLGIEVGTKYELIRSGFRATFNDPTDPDHVGYLDGENGVTGLDGADVREVSDDVVEGDGAIHGDKWHLGRRAITFQGLIDPEGGIGVVGARITKLRQIVNGGRSDDIYINWTTTNSVPVTISPRAQQPLRIAGRLPKTFSIALISDDPLIASQALHSTSVLASSGGVGGFGSPLTSPLTSGALPSGQLVVENVGTEDTCPVFIITGPITNPTIRNATTGEEINLTYTLNVGEQLYVVVADAAVKLNGIEDRDNAYDFLRSSWIKLVPGNNDIRLFAQSFSAPAALAVEWRDTWS